MTESEGAMGKGRRKNLHGWFAQVEQSKAAREAEQTNTPEPPTPPTNNVAVGNKRAYQYQQLANQAFAYYVTSMDWAEPEPPAPLPIRKSTEPILAWRAWNLVWKDDEPYLHSLTADVLWDSATLRGGGKPSDQNPYGMIQSARNPFQSARNPSFGIYAWKEAKALIEGDGVIELRALTNRVIGQIALFGKVVSHKRGYRAENGTVRKLYVLHPDLFKPSNPCAGLSVRYDCDVITDMALFAEECK